MSVTLRALAALVLLALFPVVVLAVVAALIGVAVLASKVSGYAAAKLMLVACLPIFALGKAVRDGFQARPGLSRGPELARADHPGLWELVDGMAREMRTAPPDRIVVDGAVNAAVSDVRGTREMIIGLPLLAGLTEAQLASVLGHELGHYAHGHARLASAAYRGTVLLTSTLGRVGGITHRLLRGYARLYYLLASAATRRQELQADAWSARFVGPQVAASAMNRVRVLDGAWSVLMNSYLPLSGPARRRAPLLAGFHELVPAIEAGTGSVHGEAMAEAAARRERPGRFDSHPPLSTRISRFERMPAAAGLLPSAGDEPAASVLGNGERSLAALEREILVDDDPEASWAEIVELAAMDTNEKVAAQLAGAAIAQGVPAPVTLGAILDAVERGQGHAMARALLRPELDPARVPEATTAVLRECLGACVFVALARAGQARYALSWTGPWQCELRDDTGSWQQQDAEDLVAAAVTDPAAVAHLRAELDKRGADLATVVNAATVEARARVLAASMHVQLRNALHVGGTRPRLAKAMHDVLVCTTGVVVAPPVDRLPRLAVGNHRRRTAQRLDLLVDAAGERPDEYGRVTAPQYADSGVARWIPLADIVDVAEKSRFSTRTVTLTLRDGSTFAWRPTQLTLDVDRPVRTLQRLVANRRDGGQDAE